MRSGLYPLLGGGGGFVPPPTREQNVPTSRRGDNTNKRYNLTNNNYSAMLATMLNQGVNNVCRESIEGHADNSTTTATNFANDTAASAAAYAQEWMAGRALVQEIVGEMVKCGANGTSYDAVWEQNLAWRVASMVNHWPWVEGRDYIMGPFNEWDLTVSAGNYVAMLRDQADPTSIAHADLAAERVVKACKVVRNELDGVGHFRTNGVKADFPFIGCSTAYPVKTAPSDTYSAPSRGSVYTLLTLNDGEINRYLDADDFHYHQDEDHRLPFDGSDLPEYRTCPLWIFRGRQAAAALGVESHWLRRPLVSSEAGLYYGSGRGTTASWPDVEWLRELRTGNILMGLLYWGTVMHLNYSLAGSGASQNYAYTNNNWATWSYYQRSIAPYRHTWETSVNNWNYNNYLWPSGATSKQLQIIAKDWIDYSKAETWGVFVNCNEKALGSMPTSINDLAGKCPFREYRDVVMENGKITVTPTPFDASVQILPGDANTQRTIAVPTCLGTTGNHVARCNIKFHGTNGDNVRILVRGADNGDGLYDPGRDPANIVNATAVGNNTATQTIYVPFTTAKHGNPRFPDDAQILVAIDCDGNNGNAFEISNVEVLEV